MAAAAAGEGEEGIPYFAKAGDITRCVERNCTEGVKKGAKENMFAYDEPAS